MTIFDFGAVASVLLGGCVGSFLNVCIHRLPIEGLTIARPRTSFCPKCRAPIRWHDNLPVLSWLLLGAKCRDCRAPISWRYPAIEIATAAMFLLLWARFGPASEAELASAARWGTLVLWWATFAAMLVITMVDIDHRIIPDEISVTGGSIALLVPPLLVGVPVGDHGLAFVARALAPLDAALAPGLAVPAQGALALLLAFASTAVLRRTSPDWEGNRRTWWGCRWAGAVGAALGIVAGGLAFAPEWLAGETAAALIPSLLGAGVGAGSIHAVGILGRLAFRKEAMGFGDVKLMGFLGALLGPVDVLLAIVLASFLGSVIGIGVRIATRSSYIPFGPFLCAGAAILVLAGDAVDDAIRWYLELFR